MSTKGNPPQSDYNAPATTSTVGAASCNQKDASDFTPPAGTHWPSTNFVLAAGTATFQPSTARVVIVEDTAQRTPGALREECHWFLPRGRKDQGETLEQCAVRETLEEAGYVATLLRAPIHTRQPKGTGSENSHSEAFHIQLLPYLARRDRLPTHISGIAMYLSFWYLCLIPDGAAREADYGAHFVGKHEKGYNSELVGVAEAVRLLSGGRLEYRYLEDGVQGSLVEKNTGQEIHWGDLEAEDAGVVEAFIVAKGWEWVTVVSEWEDVREAVGEDVSRLEI